jgi:hypothetical protein
MQPLCHHRVCRLLSIPGLNGLELSGGTKTHTPERGGRGGPGAGCRGWSWGGAGRCSVPCRPKPLHCCWHRRSSITRASRIAGSEAGQGRGSEPGHSGCSKEAICGGGSKAGRGVGSNADQGGGSGSKADQGGGSGSEAGQGGAPKLFKEGAADCPNLRSGTL